MDSGSPVGSDFRMMFAARFLLLFLSLSQDFTQGQLDASVPHVGGRRVGLGVPPELPVLWDELRGLNELVLSLKAEEVDRRQALRRMESRLRDREVEAEQQGRSLDGLEETVIQQREGLRSMEVDRKLLTELNSDLRRKVEQLEEQSEGGGLKLLKEALNTKLSPHERRVESTFCISFPFPPLHL